VQDLAEGNMNSFCWPELTCSVISAYPNHVYFPNEIYDGRMLSSLLEQRSSCSIFIIWSQD